MRRSSVAEQEAHDLKAVGSSPTVVTNNVERGGAVVSLSGSYPEGRRFESCPRSQVKG